MIHQEIPTTMTKIKAAAIKDKLGKLHTGRMHDDIGVDGERGFLTTDGDFVGRKEGMVISREAGQLIDDEGSDELHSRMTRMTDYQEEELNDDLSTKTVLVAVSYTHLTLPTNREV